MGYHIRWSIGNRLDWECHPTREAAEESAKRLVREGESYTIEECQEQDRIAGHGIHIVPPQSTTPEHPAK